MDRVENRRTRDGLVRDHRSLIARGLLLRGQLRRRDFAFMVG
jgi:hypothetical protein